MKLKGTLIPIGGNENKGILTKEKYHTEDIEHGILSRVVMESGGPKAMIVIVPTASQIPDEVCEAYRQAFKELGCTNIHFADIRKREQSEQPDILNLFRKADCVMFSGGNQSEITKKIKDTTSHRILMERYTGEELVLAGTSAGAMCMSEEMIIGSGRKEAFIKGNVGMNVGMGFIPQLIIDSHFIKRKRFGRLAEAVAKFPNLVGVGLGENTGLVIKNCNTMEVIGSGMVIVFDPSELTHNNEALVDKGELMSLTNLKTHIMAKGDIFNIDEHKIKILHVESPAGV
mgnify:CR=1 FL=1